MGCSPDPHSPLITSPPPVINPLSSIHGLHGNPGTEVHQGPLPIVVAHPKFISTHQAIPAGHGGKLPPPLSLVHSVNPAKARVPDAVMCF